MLTKEEYLIGIYKIFGVALTAPTGKLFLEFSEPKFYEPTLNFKIYVIFSMILFIVGLILLIYGYDIVYMSKRK